MKAFLTNLIALLACAQAFSQPSDFDSVNFDAIDSVAALYNNYELKDQKKLVGLLTKDLKSDVEKFRVIFKWITNNISYDLELLKEKNKKEKAFRGDKGKLEKWNGRFNRKLLRKLIANKSSICQGYATLLQSMCAISDLQCEIVEGYARTIEDRVGRGKIDHAWNVIHLNNKWYLCDPTWASGYVDTDFNMFRKHFQKVYFLTDPNLFIANHYPKNTTWTLLYDKPSIKEFLNAPIKTDGFIQNKINRYKPEAGLIRIERDSTIRFAFTSNLKNGKIENVAAEVYKLEGRVYKHKADKDSHTILKSDNEGFLYFDYKLTEKGNYLIYLYIEGRLSFEYEVTCQ